MLNGANTVFCCKTKFTRLHVCLHNALLKWCQMTSQNFTFVDVICALYHILLNHIAMLSLFSQLTCALI